MSNKELKKLVMERYASPLAEGFQEALKTVNFDDDMVFVGAKPLPFGFWTPLLISCQYGTDSCIHIFRNIRSSGWMLLCDSLNSNFSAIQLGHDLQDVDSIEISDHRYIRHKGIWLEIPDQSTEADMVLSIESVESTDRGNTVTGDLFAVLLDIGVYEMTKDEAVESEDNSPTAVGKPEITAVLATDRNGGIGIEDRLPWPRSQIDMNGFRESTMGKVCIVGGRTANTLPKLKGRVLYVMDRKWFENRKATLERLTESNNGLVRLMAQGMIANEDISDDSLDCSASVAILDIIDRYPGLSIAVIGGAFIYKLFAKDYDFIHQTLFDDEFEVDTSIDFADFLDPDEIRSRGTLLIEPGGDYPHAIHRLHHKVKIGILS